MNSEKFLLHFVFKNVGNRQSSMVPLALLTMFLFRLTGSSRWEVSTAMMNKFRASLSGESAHSVEEIA